MSNEVRELKDHVRWLEDQQNWDDGIQAGLDEIKDEVNEVRNSIDCINENLDQIFKAINNQNGVLKELIAVLGNIGMVRAPISSDQPKPTKRQKFKPKIVDKDQPDGPSAA